MKNKDDKRKANAEYWRRRAEKTKDISTQKAESFIADMERQYRIASRNIENEVNSFLTRFAQNEIMTLHKARKLLNADELKDFKMELEDYIRMGEKNGISADWTKQLENASLLHRIDRLEALKMQIDNQIETLAAYKEQGLNKTLGEVFEESYYRNIFDVQQMMGQGSAFAVLDERKIKQAISKPWRYDGKTFSDSIWENKEKLKYSLERTLTQGIIRGSAPRKIAEAIAKETGRELYAAKRLVLTESAEMAERASEEGYRELGVKEIEIVVALDERTCEVCGEMDGKHFPLDKAEGLTPPFHPNCRCTTVPYFDDEFTQGEERAAKDEDGKTYYVPADMTYKEWKKSLGANFDFNFKKVKNKFIDVMASHDPVNLDGLPKKYDNEVKEIKRIIGNADSRIKNYTLKNIDNSMIINENAVGTAFTTETKGEIIFNMGNARLDKRGAYTPYFHELGHSLDKLTGTKSVELDKYLHKDYERLIDFYSKRGVSEEKAKDEILDTLKVYRHKASSTMDLFKGLSGRATDKGSHNKNYWKKRNRFSLEAFAHFFEATIRCDEEKISLLSATFPSAYKAFIEIIEGDSYV